MDNYGTVDNPAWISTVSHTQMQFTIPPISPGDIHFRHYDDPPDCSFKSTATMSTDFSAPLMPIPKPSRTIQFIEGTSFNHIYLEGRHLTEAEAMSTDVIANPIPELIQFYWRRTERYH